MGIEILTKIAANAPNVQDRGFHSTPVLGSIGAAIACASLLRLDPEKIKATLGITASGAGGIHRQQGSMVKPFTPATLRATPSKPYCSPKRASRPTRPSSKRRRGFCDTFLRSGNL